ncbi:MAG: hypothetical protein R8J84_05820 [Mariprofundales bacterium]
MTRKSHKVDLGESVIAEAGAMTYIGQEIHQADRILANAPSVATGSQGE